MLKIAIYIVAAGIGFSVSPEGFERKNSAATDSDTFDGPEPRLVKTNAQYTIIEHSAAPGFYPFEIIDAKGHKIFEDTATDIDWIDDEIIVYLGEGERDSSWLKRNANKNLECNKTTGGDVMRAVLVAYNVKTKQRKPINMPETIFCSQ